MPTLFFSTPLDLLANHLRPRQFGTGWLSHDWAIPNTVSAPNVKTLAQYAVSSALDSVWAVSAALPPHLLLSLIYRVVALHFAARIVPMIRRGWEDGSDAAPNFWDGRSLGEEPTVSGKGAFVLCPSYPLIFFS